MDTCSIEMGRSAAGHGRNSGTSQGTVRQGAAAAFGFITSMHCVPLLISLIDVLTLRLLLRRAIPLFLSKRSLLFVLRSNGAAPCARAAARPGLFRLGVECVVWGPGFEHAARRRTSGATTAGTCTAQTVYAEGSATDCSSRTRTCTEACSCCLRSCSRFSARCQACCFRCGEQACNCRHCEGLCTSRSVGRRDRRRRQRGL